MTGLRRIGTIGLLSLGLVGVRAISADAATTYYLGAFTSSTPLDDGDCGTGTGTHPSPHPCATLAYWNANRRATALTGCSATAPCMVRLAPGTYLGVSNTNYNCVVAQSNVTYEGRRADDSGLPTDFNQVVIDAKNNTGPINLPIRGNVPCRGMSLIPLNAGDHYPDTTVAQINNFTVRYMTLANAPYDSNEYRTGAALYGASGSSNLVMDHVRVTGNKMTGLMVGETNWRINQCSGNLAWCSESCTGLGNGALCPNGDSACTGQGTCTYTPDYDCAVTGRRTTNVTITDSQFDHNSNDQAHSDVSEGGMIVGCVDRFTFQRIKSFENHETLIDGACCYCTSNADCLGGAACDLTTNRCGTSKGYCAYPQGIRIAGGINGTIDTFEAYNNGYAEFNFGNSENFGEHDNTADRLYLHSSCPKATQQQGLRFTGGHHDTVRNSFVVGSYMHGIEQYNCSHHVTLENNTFWNTSNASGYTMHNRSGFDWTYKNNIFRGFGQGAGVILGTPNVIFQPSTWDHNVLYNEGSTPFSVEYDSKTVPGICSCTAATEVADCGAVGSCRSQECINSTATAPYNNCTSDSQCNVAGGRACILSSNEGGGCLPLKNHGVYPFNVIPIPPSNAVACDVGRLCLPMTAAALTTFQGVGSGWFGGGQGAGDKWGTAPAMVNSSSPNPANLHLVSTDVIARDAGVTIPGLTTDYDGQARPFGQGYDIGADEYSTAAVGLVGDLDGNSVVDVLDLQRMVNVLLGLETDQTVLARADLDGQNGPTILDLQRLVNLLLGV